MQPDSADPIASEPPPGLVMLLYASTSTLLQSTASSSVEELVTQSVVKNRFRAITGSLIFTGQHFAQLLEGSRDNVAALMASIERDERHRDVNVITSGPIDRRRFPTWSLAYVGPSRFVSGHITRLMDEGAGTPPSRTANWLIEMMLEFSRFHESDRP